MLFANTVALALPYAKYFNYILIGSSLIFIGYIRFFYKKKKKSNKPCQSKNKQDDGFLDDNEICLEERTIEPLINIIKSHSSLSFFSMALIGKWGSGKSSYLKTLENKLNDEYEIIKINVWQLENSENITNEIRKEFDNILFESNRVLWLLQLIKRLFIRDYFSVLSKYATKSEIKATFAFEPTINASQNDFNELLKEVLGNKKVLLLIDELDRLESKDEIINIFKVIRYTASFDNVFVITALDMKQIENKFEENIDYIHKIFNLKYLVPNIDKDELINYIEKNIILKFKEFSIKESELNILSYSFDRNKIIDFINSYREVKNVFNDTYAFIKYLEEDSKDWNEYISFEFIFILNLIKAVDFELYSKLLFDEQLLILSKAYKEPEKDVYNKKLNYIISEKMKNTKFNLFLVEILKVDNFKQHFDIYQQQKIYNYHVSQTKYNNYIKDIIFLENDFNKITYNENDKEKFLLNVLSKNQKDKKNHSLILNKVIELMSKDIFYYQSKIFKKIGTDIFVTEETNNIFIKLLKFENDIPFVFIRYLIEHTLKSKNDIDSNLIIRTLTCKFFKDLKIKSSQFNEDILKLFHLIEKTEEHDKFKIYKIIYNCFDGNVSIIKTLLSMVKIEDIINMTKEIDVSLKNFIDDENEYEVWIEDKWYRSKLELFNGKELKEKIKKISKNEKNKD